MIKLTESQRDGLHKWLPDKADSLIMDEDVNGILQALNFLSIDLMTKDYETTEDSREVERLMDSIAWDNTHDENGNKL